MIRELRKEEYPKAIDLSFQVCMECGIHDFTEEGIQTFKQFVYNESLINELHLYGAFNQETLVGILGVNSQKQHISLFFILSSHHRKGIGKSLFHHMLNACKLNEMTVNSSTYAVPFYTALGFKKTGEKQCSRGITSVPMARYEA